MKKIIAYLTVLLVFSSCGSSQFKGKYYHDNHWPVWLPQHAPDRKGKLLYNKAQVVPGTVYLNNRDTARGFIKFLSYHPDLPHTTSITVVKWQDMPKEWMTRYNRDAIDSVKTFMDPEHRYGEALFVKVQPKTLWREIAVRNSSNIGIYTPLFFMAWDNKYYPYIILYSEGKKYTIMKRLFHGDVTGKHLRGALVRFIQHRYGIKQHRRDYKDEKTLFNFILDQEEIKIRKK